MNTKFFPTFIFSLLLLSQLLTAQQTQHITLQLKWKHQFQFAGYYAAIEKGFYKESGFDVTLLEAEEGKHPSDVVFNGKADFGVCTTDIILSRAQGHDAVLLATIFQHSPLIMLGSTRSGIMHVQDLAGRKIALEPNDADIVAFMNDEGVSLEKCTIINHEFDVRNLLSGEIAAISGYATDEPFILRQNNFDYTIISPAMGGIDFYGDGLFTTETLMKKNPDLVLRFREASLKGWKYAMDNPEEMVQLIFNKYSQRHSLDHLRFEAEKMKNLIMDDVVEIGYTNPGRMSSIAETYKKVKMLDPKFQIKGLMYTDYLPSDSVIPWRLVFILSFILLVVGSTAYFFYQTSVKLKKSEIEISLKNKELIKLNAEKDKFFSIISHDLRNPFAGFIGLTNLLLDDHNTQSESERESYLSNLKNSAVNLYALLNDLLEWSKVQQQIISFSPEKLNLAEEITSSLHTLSDSIRAKEIKLKVQIPTDFHVIADSHMLQAVLRNLVSNAVKFTTNHGEIFISAKQLNDDKALISIQDSGIGMDQELIENLFRLDGKSGRTGTNGEPTSGFGLILCKEFIEKHNGKIWVESEPKKGSTFYFTLPGKPDSL